MSAEPEPEPTPETSPTTALAIVPDEPVSTTVPLETKRVALEFWTARRDLHQPTTKAYRELADKCLVLKQAYERELAAHRGRQLMQPQRRLETAKKRKATLLQRRADSIGRVVKAVKGLGSVKDDDALAVAIADALEPPEPPKKKAKKAKKVAEEEEDEE